jgi:hypothetical protein
LIRKQLPKIDKINPSLRSSQSLSHQLVIVGKLMRQPQLCRALIAVAGLHFLLVSFGLPSWPCPIRHGLGIPCPGCGITRAMLALVQGHWATAITIHAVAPIAWVIVLLIGLGAILPIRLRRLVGTQLARVEQRTGLTLVLLLLLMVYWLVRLIFFKELLYSLVM